eukprot:jgi/Picsp_1/5162/NSC_02525-R1_protein
MSDHCIVCADTLEFTAYGPCGHKDTCSKCVMRLRTVLNDDRCVYCQQPAQRVFVTRYAGDFTKILNSDEFLKLDTLVQSGEYKYLPEAKAYFDDFRHYDVLRKFCTYSHPGVGDGKTFKSLKALQQQLKRDKNAQFCSICLEGRKVFLSEQLIYSKNELERHMRRGDEDGPMSNYSGFKGHPECRFCRRRFYGENEIYHHMHSTHEECFICKRAEPSSHVYYRDYAEMEGHFRTEHYLCEHPSCLEQKFVVFRTEQELKTHSAKEHSQDMSKAELKQARSLQVSFNYNREGQGSAPAPTPALLGRNAIVIGGDANMPSRSRGNSRTNLVLADQMSALQIQEASMEAGREPVPLRDHDFPSISAGNVAPAIGGNWASATHSTSLPSREDFPALPGTSKTSKRRNAKKKNLKDAVGVRGQVRVLNSGSSNFPPLNSSVAQATVQVDERQKDVAEGFNSSISGALRDANAKLAERIKSKIGGGKKYEDFRSNSLQWVKGEIQTSDYHRLITKLGLANFVPDLASTCTNGQKRDELLKVHAVAFEHTASPNSLNNWIPPEVAEVTAKQVSNGSWKCSVCTLLNIHHAKMCEACGALRSASTVSEDFPTLNSEQVASTSAALSMERAKDSTKKGKQSLSEFYKKTSKHPQNPWKNPNLKGTWASKGAGSLAQHERALNQAYSKGDR